ncbi:MAG: hypothetical protein FJY97_20980 [candidate division Zixibacteria bacterium]|nr:hypothetical protein [candidate division Zixibacteria bacterium]
MMHAAVAYRAYRDWKSVMNDMEEPGRLIDILDTVIERAPRLVEVQRAARRIISTYPSSIGARTLGEMLDITDEDRIASPGFIDDLKRERATLEKTVIATT